MYGAKVYRCAPERVKHVDSEIVELSAWLPITLRNWKSTIRERGAGNLVELDKERFPPPEEQEVREEAEHEAQDGQGVQGGSEDVDMEHVEQLVVPGVHEQEGASDMLRDGGGAQQEPVEAMNVPSPAGSEQQGPMSVDEPAAEPPGSDTHMDAPAGAWTTENTQYGPVRTSSLTHAMRNSLNRLDFGAPIRRMPDHETLCLEHQKGMPFHVLVNETNDEPVNETQTVRDVDKSEQKQRKVKHRELQEKQLSPEQREELNRAKTKEWEKIN